MNLSPSQKVAIYNGTIELLQENGKSTISRLLTRYVIDELTTHKPHPQPPYNDHDIDMLVAQAGAQS